MRTIAVISVLVFAGMGVADDKILKPNPKDMKGDLARPYAGKKVEVTGRVVSFGVDKKQNKWYFRCDLMDEKNKDMAVTIYLFFEDMDAATELKEKLKEKPVAIVRGICELYQDLAPNSKVPPVILNGTEIVEYKQPAKKDKDK